MVSRYVPNGPVKQDLCLLPPQHFRMLPPPRADGYTVPTPAGSYVPTAANQGGNQGPGGLRGIPQSVPPSSTPPNADLKVQSVPQQSSINPSQLMFSQSVRPTQQFYPRSTPPSSQNQRMASHNNRPQPPMYHQQIYPVPQQQVFIPGLPYNTGNRQPNFVQTLPVYTGAPFQYSFNAPQNTPPAPLQYYYNAAVVPRTGTIQPAQPAAPNPPQATMPLPMVSNNTQHQHFQKQSSNKRRPHAIKVIHPDTGVDRLEEVLGENPTSGESSARETPQPSASQNQVKEVQATFAKQVMQAINTGVDSQQRIDDEDDHHHHHPQHHLPHHQPHSHMAPPPTSAGGNLQHQPPGHPHLNQDGGDPHNFQPPTHLHHHPQSHIEHQQLGQYAPPPSQQVHVPPQPAAVIPTSAIITSSPVPASSNVPSAESNIEHIVRNSTFNAMAKEFVLPSPSSNINTAKETTPVVSALCDAEEVTLPPKLPKDRESPVKGRKWKEHLQQKISDSSSSLLSTAEHQLEKTPSSNSDEKSTISDAKKHKDTSLFNTTNVPQVISKEVIPEEVSEPKKIQKKDNKVDAKVEICDVDSQLQQSPPVVQDVTTAKPKQNARNASKQSGQQPAHQNNPNQKASSTTVPQSQPPKASNKSHKKNDLNQKGANKEGTDMDAFNDNTVKETKETTVTVNNVSTNNSAAISDIVNANSHITNNLSSSVVVTNNSKDSVNNEINNKKFESNDATNNSGNATIKSTSTVVPAPAAMVKPKTNKVDVTSIVREQPKVIATKHLSGGNNNNSTDEIDRAAPSNDLLNANNNNNKLASIVNSSEQTAINAIPKTNSENNNRIEIKLPYQEGQWTPTNPNGFKVYQKEFLLALKNCPNSRIKPEKIYDCVAADDRGRLSDGRASMGGRPDFTNPTFNTYGGGGKSGSQRGTGPKRNSSQSKQGIGGSNNKNVKAPQAKVSISLREDVKLHESENAWRPARLAKGEIATDDDRKTDELYKNVRGILNKLTPQKFDTLLGQIKALQIDNPERLQGVIDLVFNKAVDEPNFSVAYAKMCKELALMHVPTANSTPEKEEFVNFRKLLITRCQVEFEKQSHDESVRNTKLKEIGECTDPEKKKDLEFDLEEYDRKLRMKSVGNVRFIGELFKQDMLTVNIMMRCLTNLLEHKDEEGLECLCKLMTTIGKELENKHVDLVPIFNTMKSIADKKDGKVSSRIRFMLQDVIDLRLSKWIPRRQDLNPKTIDQIQKEAEREQMNIQMNLQMNSGPATPRKDDRVGGGGPGGMGMDRKGGRGARNVTDDGGWIITGSNRNNRGSSAFSIQSDKLKNKAHLDGTTDTFGSMMFFQQFSKGSQGTKTSTQPLTNTGNIYSALENNSMDSDKRLGFSRSKDSYNSKGPSLERNYNKFDGRGSRSGSQHRSSNDTSSTSSSQRGGLTSLPPMGSITMGPPRGLPLTGGAAGAPSDIPVPTKIPASGGGEPMPQLSEEQMERSVNNSLDEYVSGNAKVHEYFQAISSCIPPQDYSQVIVISYLRVFGKSQNDRLKTGELFAKLVKQGQIHLEDYCVGLEEILSQADDLKIDLPKIWDYLAEILVDIVIEDVLPLNRLFDLLEKKLINPSDISKLLAYLFKLIISRKGSAFLQQLWQSSGLGLNDILDSSCVNSFVKDNQLEFLLEGSAPASMKELSFEDIQEHLSGLLRKKASHDEIFHWITENVGDRVKENKFIRALATAIFEDSISSSYKLLEDILMQHSNLLLKYIDNKSNYELEGLYALQALVHKLEHPKGLLLSICTTLLDSLMFSHESFVAWEQSTDPAEQEGKGVALKQLTAFICQLKENDDDDDTSGEDA